MVEIFKFIFSDIFHFLGTIILLNTVFEGIKEIIRAIREKEYDTF